MDAVLGTEMIYLQSILAISNNTVIYNEIMAANYVEEPFHCGTE